MACIHEEQDARAYEQYLREQEEARQAQLRAQQLEVRKKYYAMIYRRDSRTGNLVTAFSVDPEDLNNIARTVVSINKWHPKMRGDVFFDFADINSKRALLGLMPIEVRDLNYMGVEPWDTPEQAQPLYARFRDQQASAEFRQRLATETPEETFRRLDAENRVRISLEAFFSNPKRHIAAAMQREIDQMEKQEEIEKYEAHIDSTKARIARLRQEITVAANRNDFGRAEELREELQEAKQELKQLEFSASGVRGS